MGNPSLTIELDRGELVEQEPILVRLSLSSAGDTVDVPTELSSGDTTRFELLDAEGKTLAVADGYTRDQRQGLEVVPIDPATMLHAPLGPGDVARWQEDLLSFVPPPGPGSYALRARFRAPRSGATAHSQTVEFRVRPLRATELDVIVDEVAMTVVHLAQVHVDGGDVRALVQARPAAAPGVIWEAASLGDIAASCPRISVAGFRTRDTYEHDFTRWLAWLDDGALCVAVVRSSQGEALTRPPVGARLAWIGRPVQHADGSLAILALTDDDEPRLVRITLDPQGQASLDPLMEGRSIGEPRVDGCDDSGHQYLLHASPGGLQLLRIDSGGTVSTSTVLSAERWADSGRTVERVLGIELDLKPRVGLPASTISVVLLLRSGDERLLWWGAWDRSKPGSGWNAAQIVLRPEALAEGEQPLRAQAVPRARDLQPRLILATSHGRLLSIEEDGRCVVRVGRRTEAIDAWRVIVLQGEHHLFHLEGGSARHLRLR